MSRSSSEPPVLPVVIEVREEMREEILRRLQAAEVEHGVKILYACESGSRAWGFASPDSDFDVRFLYVHDRDWYLSYDVDRRRDVIEYPIVDLIDCGGWDLRKALSLFAGTNGPLLEWLHSPITYIESGTTAQQLRHLAAQVYNPTTLCYHYRQMARNSADQRRVDDQVRLKKVLYALRSLLAIRFIQLGHGIPPVEFAKLVAAVAPKEVRPSIAALIEVKQSMPELGLGDPIPEIEDFIESELVHHEGQFAGQGSAQELSKKEVRDALNLVFREAISHILPTVSQVPL